MPLDASIISAPAGAAAQFSAEQLIDIFRLVSPSITGKIPGGYWTDKRVLTFIELINSGKQFEEVLALVSKISELRISPHSIRYHLNFFKDRLLKPLTSKSSTREPRFQHDGATEARLRDEIVKMIPRLRRFAAGLTGKQAQAGDIVQDVLLRALPRLHQFDPQTRMDSWLFRIAQTIWLDQIRADDIRRANPIEWYDKEGYGDSRLALESNQEAQRMLTETREVIAKLPPDYKTIIMLVGIEGLSYKETGKLLGIPVGTVMSRLARARAALKLMLEKRGGSEGNSQRPSLNGNDLWRNRPKRSSTHGTKHMGLSVERHKAAASLTHRTTASRQRENLGRPLNPANNTNGLSTVAEKNGAIKESIGLPEQAFKAAASPLSKRPRGFLSNPERIDWMVTVHKEGKKPKAISATIEQETGYYISPRVISVVLSQAKRKTAAAPIAA